MTREETEKERKLDKDRKKKRNQVENQKCRRLFFFFFFFFFGVVEAIGVRSLLPLEHIHTQKK